MEAKLCSIRQEMEDAKVKERSLLQERQRIEEERQLLERSVKNTIERIKTLEEGRMFDRDVKRAATLQVMDAQNGNRVMLKQMVQLADESEALKKQLKEATEGRERMKCACSSRWMRASAKYRSYRTGQWLRPSTWSNYREP